LDLTTIVAGIIGIAGLIAVNYATSGALMALIMKFYDFIKDYVTHAFRIVYAGFTYLWKFINFLLEKFPLDDSKKLLYLAAIFFFSCVAIIMLLSSSSYFNGGVDNIVQKNFEMADFSGMGVMGDSGLRGNMNANGTFTPDENGSIIQGNDNQPNQSTDCISDEQCRDSFGEPDNMNLKCCFRTQYDGYSCAGRCLRDEDYDRDACKLPNACKHNVDTETWDSFAGDSLTRCDNKAGSNLGGDIAQTPDYYCRLLASDTEQINAASNCCTVGPCYGYCTKPDGSKNCYDWTACYTQNEIIPKTVSVKQWKKQR